MLTSIISPGGGSGSNGNIDIKLGSTLEPLEVDFESPNILIFINSVKPLLTSANQSKQFQLYVPFTTDGRTHAKTIDKQWKREIIFTVRDFFPSATIRQVIISKELRTLSPIEVSIDDIYERTKAMRSELSSPKDASNVNNLMRVIQGSILPQVDFVFVFVFAFVYVLF